MTICVNRDDAKRDFGMLCDSSVVKFLVRKGRAGMTRLDAIALMYISMYIDVMSKRYSIAEARSNLPTIVDQAEAGAEVELTRRGKPVAVIISHRQLERLRSDRPRFVDSYRAFLRKHSLQDVGIENDFFQIAREKSAGRKVSL